MNKENILFATMGLLLGLIIGFMFANSVNQSAAVVATPAAAAGMMQQNANMPPGHPEIAGGNSAGMQPQVQAAIEKAKQEPDNFEAQVKAAELHYQIQQFGAAVEFLERANK